MDIEENIAGLGKNHDRAAHENDIAKKQSEATPAAENLDMMPNTVSKPPIHQEAENYRKEEHQKADDWENHVET
ncbi:MAG TPA: hypothetical protein VL088_15465 [Pedobacter sp.]|nr:hypothetical protein [Pedobacter sp.]